MIPNAGETLIQHRDMRQDPTQRGANASRGRLLRGSQRTTSPKLVMWIDWSSGEYPRLRCGRYDTPGESRAALRPYPLCAWQRTLVEVTTICPGLTQAVRKRGRFAAAFDLLNGTDPL